MNLFRIWANIPLIEPHNAKSDADIEWPDRYVLNRRWSSAELSAAITSGKFVAVDSVWDNWYIAVIYYFLRKVTKRKAIHSTFESSRWDWLDFVRVETISSSFEVDGDPWSTRFLPISSKLMGTLRCAAATSAAKGNGLALGEMVSRDMFLWK
jgi:hypothetical protein